MLEARIVTSRGLRYSVGEVSPYDLETLKQHLREFRRSAPDGHEVVTLELTLGDGPRCPFLVAWLWTIKATGFRVRVRRPQPVDHAV
jgi:hypothetical protein